MSLTPTDAEQLSVPRKKRKGVPHSAETRRKLSLARRGRWRGPENPHWRGGFFLNKGYRYAYAPEHPNATQDGYVLEHRLVAERMIGRLLLRSEAVHHRNGDTLDNRPENLEVCASNGRHSADHHVKRAADGRFACSA